MHNIAASHSAKMFKISTFVNKTWIVLQVCLCTALVKLKRLEDEAFQGCPAPNTPVIDLRRKVRHILDFMQDSSQGQDLEECGRLQQEEYTRKCLHFEFCVHLE
ncbi:UNVERIFIED_CONTAM: hypothetical protein K2H54_054442 [Gekko kuhli]